MATPAGARRMPVPVSRSGGVTVALAVVACLVVFGTAGLAAVVAVSGGSTTGTEETEGPLDPLNPTQTGSDLPDPAFPSAQYGDFRDYGAYFEVPGYDVGWVAPSGPDGNKVYWDLEGGKRLSIKGAGAYGLGVCREGRITGFAGIPRPTEDQPDDPRQAGLEVVSTYADAVGYNDKTGGQVEVSEPDQEDWTLSDGTPAVFTAVVVDIPPGGEKCNPKQTELAAVTFESGDRFVTLLVGRDLDFPKKVERAERERRPLIDVETRDKILRSARPLS